MPTYVSLINYTQQGIQNFKDSPSRLEAAKQAFKAAGGEIKGYYLTLGRYDAIVISEMPNDETGATLAIAIASQGNIRTETLRAFTEDEMKGIVANLP
jgi:uncharacterized protein with GYD domain